MTLEQAQLLTKLAKQMLIRASQDFDTPEYIESVKLFNEVSKELTHANLDNDTTKNNNNGDED